MQIQKFGVSQPIRRTEDLRFLTGTGRYIDDTAPDDALHSHVLRSTVAHGVLKSVDASGAEAAPGVRLVITRDTLAAQGIDKGMDFVPVENRDGSKGARPKRPILAEDKVRFVGEPIAYIVADTLQQAKDAAELIEVEIDDLPAHTALRPGGETLHEEAPGNVVFDWAAGDEEATAAAFEAAAHKVSLTVEDNRIHCVSMEPRGNWARMEDGRLHICVSHQNAWGPKRNTAKILNMDEDDVRITIPDVGGGFGMKGMDYPEQYLCGLAARMLDRPVRWMSDRSEAMLTDNAGRDLVSTAELAFDANHRLTAYRVNSVSNIGAYCSNYSQNIQTNLSLRVLTGVYDVRNFFFGVKGVFTNTTQVDAYRGAGRPEAIFTLERAMDAAARELGVDPWELRRKNFITREQMPYVSASGETYDVGDFHMVLGRAETIADRAGFAARKAESGRRGKLRGFGLCYYIESILGDPAESSAIEFDGEGRAALHVGTVSNGQGHETVYKQVLHEFSGIPFDAIDVVMGDSDRIKQGGGTGGSRSVTTQGTATRGNVLKAVEAFKEFLAGEWDSKPVDFDDGRFSSPGSNRTATMIEAAELAREKGRDDLLRHEHREQIEARSYPNGAHVCEVEVDPDTGVVKVDKYTVVDDLGVLMNPILAEGQVHGGVVQGIGQAVTEHVVYDDDGQLMAASFMDYALPRAPDTPMIDFHSAPVPSTGNPFGMKGCGEAGTVGALAAVSNAVEDALWERGVRRTDMPYTPLRVWGWLAEAG